MNVHEAKAPSALETAMTRLNTLPFSGLAPMRVVFQSEAAECGLACMAMILSFHGKQVDLRGLRAQSGASLKGSKLSDLIDLASSMGLNNNPVRVEMSDLARLETPALLHWDMNHYVVLEKATSKKITILDPALGRRQLPLGDASKHVTGVAVEFRPNVDFKKESQIRRLRWRDLIRGAVGLKKHLLVVFALALIANLINLIAPQFIQYVIDVSIANRDADGLFLLALGFSIVLAFALCVSMFQSFAVLNLKTSLLFQFRQSIFRHLLFLPSKYFETRSVGDIVSRIDSYDRIQDVMSVDAINAAIQGLFAVVIGILIFLYSWKIFILVVVYFAINLLIGLVFYPHQRLRAMEAVVAQAAAESKTIENIRGNQSIKALGIENQALNNWVIAQADAVNADLASTKLNIWQGVPTGLLDIVDRIAIPAFALFLVIEGELTLGMFYAVNAYKSQFTGVLNTLVDVAFKVAYSGIHLDRLADIVLERPERPISYLNGSEQRARKDAAPLTNVNKIDLAAGSFRYAENDPWIFENVDLSLEKGKRISLIGPSGSGKTTLLKVLSSMLTLSRGTLRVNGEKLSAENLSAYRRRIGMVMQNDSLFAGSIAHNVALSDEHTDLQRVAEVCQIADIHDEIIMMPMQYETLIGDMGSALSTGQRQRIILARALYSNPDFLFLDEGTAHLDPGSELRILQRLEDMDVGIIFSVHNKAALQFSHSAYIVDGGSLRAVDL